jgi:hypothetical protein
MCIVVWQYGQIHLGNFHPLKESAYSSEDTHHACLLNKQHLDAPWLL